MPKIHEMELEELAALALGRREGEVDELIEDGDVDSDLFEKFSIDFETFSAIACALIEFVPPVQAGLSGKWFQAFVHDGAMIARVEYKPDGNV